ncbi:MAG: hypothetical protein QXT77_08665 [Candidatus Methanomethylicaceae archaeon]
MARIRALTGGSFSFEFDKEDAKIINEMVGHFNTQSPEDVILKALSLLYTIYLERPNARVVIVQDNSGKSTIPLF